MYIIECLLVVPPRLAQAPRPGVPVGGAALPASTAVVAPSAAHRSRAAARKSARVRRRGGRLSVWHV
ncbi:hypothetical protein ACTMSW_20465 [Micromonospora sp. BQ11]|uniref:hypothetical protein n=1 Tax=Micromonospora sp. BQ11 TaxID=3452212 RepID=UPI003F8B18F8